MKKKVIITSALVLLLGGSALAVSIPKEEQNKVKESAHVVEKKKEVPVVIEDKTVEQEPVQIQTTASPQQVVPNEPVAPIQPQAPSVNDLAAKYGWNDLAEPQKYIDQFELYNPGYFSGSNLERSMAWVNEIGAKHATQFKEGGARVLYFEKFYSRNTIEQIVNITGVAY